MKIEFNEQQLVILNSALLELPYRIAAPLINNINEQIKQNQIVDAEDQEINHPKMYKSA